MASVDVNQKSLDGKVAIVTGSSRGIGRATVLALLQAGVSVVGVSRSGDKNGTAGFRTLAEEAADLGGRYEHVAGDVRESATVDEAVAVAQKFSDGRLDLLVNNAGIGSYADFDTYSENDYDHIMDTNMRSTFVFTSRVVPVMKQQRSGAIIQVASQAGLRGFPRESIYCASKHAQVGFTRGLRLELQPFGIKVGVICPAGVRTAFALDQGRTQEFIDTAGFLEAEDVAAGILFMTNQSEKSRIVEMGLISLDEGI